MSFVENNLYEKKEKLVTIDEEFIVFTIFMYPISFELDFKRNPYKGLYIALEGIDGSGKTTQGERLASYFTKKGKSVVRTQEPRKTEGIVGRIINEILQARTEVPPVALQHLFTADRVLHYEEIIIPALEEGEVVISDRCFWSAIPYGILDRMVAEDGGYNYEMGKVILAAQGILSMYHQFMVPDHTFYLNVPVDTGLHRKGDTDAKKEIYETKEKLDKIVLGYKWLAKEFPKEIVTIDGTKSVDEVTKDILSYLK